MFGLAWIAVLSALGWSDSGWATVLRRGVFVLGVAVMLGATSVIVAASNGVPRLNPSRTGMWFYCLGCAVPVTALAFLAARRAFAHTFSSAFGTLAAMLVLAASGAAFRERGKPIDGFAATAHDHHAVVVAGLLVPLVVLVGACRPLRGSRALELSARAQEEGLPDVLRIPRLSATSDETVLRARRSLSAAASRHDELGHYRDDDDRRGHDVDSGVGDGDDHASILSLAISCANRVAQRCWSCAKQRRSEALASSR